jgi:hypothetical protein
MNLQIRVDDAAGALRLIRVIRELNEQVMSGAKG